MTAERSHTDVGALRTAIERCRPAAAVAAVERLQAASVTTLLADLAAALRADRLDDAEVLLGRLTEAYAAGRPEQRARTTATRRGQWQAGVTIAEQRRLAGYLRTVTATRLQRAEVIAATTALLAEPSASDRTAADVASIAEATKARETALDEQRSAAQSITETVTLPATLAVVDLTIEPARIERGESTTVGVTVENVGDEAATGVTATVRTAAVSGGLDYGAVAADTTATRRRELTPTETGPRTVTVAVTAAETTPVTRSAVVVVAATGPGTLPGQSAPATDPDGDGRYEDVTGDNRFDVADVAAFLNAFDEIDPADVEFVDFSGDGQVSILDVARLLEEL